MKIHNCIIIFFITIFTLSNCDSPYEIIPSRQVKFIVSPANNPNAPCQYHVDDLVHVDSEMKGSKGGFSEESLGYITQGDGFLINVPAGKNVSGKITMMAQCSDCCTGYCWEEENRGEPVYEFHYVDDGGVYEVYETSANFLFCTVCGCTLTN